MQDWQAFRMMWKFGQTPTTFKIKYLGSKELEENDKTYYPSIIDGVGNGMLDDVGKFDLEDIVKDTDKLGYSKYSYSPGYGTNKKGYENIE